MMDPAPIPQGADPIPNTACVDVKRLRCSAVPADPVSKVLIKHNTSSWPAPVPPLDDENLLREILLRLPPKPSSLPRASLVCKRWRSILSEPQFLHCFRKHHQKPLLLGFFDRGIHRAPIFRPVLDPPDRIPASRFTLPGDLVDGTQWRSSFFGCRHGVALLLDCTRREAILWDAITGVHRRVAFPPGFNNGQDNVVRSAAVLCSAGNNHEHVRGDCHLGPFKLVLACQDARQTKAITCLYESKSDVWGDIVSTTTTYVISRKRPSILVENALCWLLDGGGILEFDFERQTLVVIEKPTDAHAIDCYYRDWSFQILRERDNSLGLAVLSNSKLSIQLWARQSNYDGVVSWVLQKTVQLNELFSQPHHMKKLVLMMGYDEDTNVIIVSSGFHDFMLHLESMQDTCIRRVEYRSFRMYYPYTNFYTAGRGIACGDGGPKNVNT